MRTRAMSLVLRFDGFRTLCDGEESTIGGPRMCPVILLMPLKPSQRRRGQNMMSIRVKIESTEVDTYFKIRSQNLLSVGYDRRLWTFVL